MNIPMQIIRITEVLGKNGFNYTLRPDDITLTISNGARSGDVVWSAIGMCHDRFCKDFLDMHKELQKPSVWQQM